MLTLRGKLINRAEEKTIRGNKQQIQYGATTGANAEKLAAEGGPTSCGSLVCSACSSLCILLLCPYMIFLLWPNLEMFLGRLAPTSNVFSASLQCSLGPNNEFRKLKPIVVGVRFSKNVFSSKGSQITYPQKTKIPKSLELLDCTTVLSISTC